MPFAGGAHLASITNELLNTATHCVVAVTMMGVGEAGDARCGADGRAMESIASQRRRTSAAHPVAVVDGERGAEDDGAVGRDSEGDEMQLAASAVRVEDE